MRMMREHPELVEGTSARLYRVTVVVLSGIICRTSHELQTRKAPRTDFHRLWKDLQQGNQDRCPVMPGIGYPKGLGATDSKEAKGLPGEQRQQTAEFRPA